LYRADRAQVKQARERTLTRDRRRLGSFSMSDDEAAAVDVFKALNEGASRRRAAAALLLLHLVSDDAGVCDTATTDGAAEAAESRGGARGRFVASGHARR
jgi:hypothetical protein